MDNIKQKVNDILIEEQLMEAAKTIGIRNPKQLAIFATLMEYAAKKEGIVLDFSEPIEHVAVKLYNNTAWKDVGAYRYFYEYRDQMMKDYQDKSNELIEKVIEITKEALQTEGSERSQEETVRRLNDRLIPLADNIMQLGEKSVEAFNDDFEKLTNYIKNSKFFPNVLLIPMTIIYMLMQLLSMVGTIHISWLASATSPFRMVFSLIKRQVKNIFMGTVDDKYLKSLDGFFVKSGGLKELNEVKFNKHVRNMAEKIQNKWYEDTENLLKNIQKREKRLLVNG